jgi:hypothetical protein
VHTWSLNLPIKKADAEKRLATGWASVVTAADGTPIVDHDGDIIPIEELEKAAHEAFLLGGQGKAGDMHKRQGVASVVESIVLDKAKREALGFGEGPEGWVVTLHVHDQKLWDMVKSGERMELSLRGIAERVPA